MPIPSTLHFIHGSTAVPEKPEAFAFEFFNYTYDGNTKTADNPFIGSGLDAEGPGIYCFGADHQGRFSPAQVEGANCYANPLNGSVIGFEVSMIDENGEPVTPANESSADTIEPEMWYEVIERLITKIHLTERFYPEFIDDAIDDLAEQWERHLGGTQGSDDPDLLQAVKTLEGYVNNDFSVSECSPSDYDDLDKWKEEVKDTIALHDPASHIYDEGGVIAVVDYNMNRADNLWDVVKYLHDRCAVVKTGKGDRCYNRDFYQAVKDTLPDMTLVRCAAVNQGQFYVVFDVDAITVNSIRMHQHLLPEDTQATLLHALSVCRDEHKALGSTLEHNQIARELSNVAMAVAKSPLPEEVSHRLARTYEGETFSDYDTQLIIKAVAKPHSILWEREPGLSEHYVATRENAERPRVTRGLR